MIYSYTITLDSKDVICITDDNIPGSASITEAVEEVVPDIDKRIGLMGRRLFYKSRSGNTSEILHFTGKFIGFVPGDDLLEILQGSSMHLDSIEGDIKE